MNNPLGTNIFINKSVWGNYTESEIVEYKNRVFSHYRRVGFPFFPSDKEYRDYEFNKLIQFSASKVLCDGKLNQTMHGLGLAWSYMPHSWNVVCNDKMTPMQAFLDDTIFRKVIDKRISIGDNISDNGIRKMLKMYTGIQSVSNFRPTAAYALYNHFCKEGDTVLDMSMGFGGRLLGAIKARVNYIGCDPSVLSHNGCVDIINDYGNSDNIYTTLLCGSEDLALPDGSVDFAFTSPPYFDTEKYSLDSNQSYLKFQTRDKWVEGFLKETFRRVHSSLKEGKVMAINIANVPNFKNLENECIRVATEVGFSLADTWRLALSKPPAKNKVGFKYEPIFIFTKN